MKRIVNFAPPFFSSSMGEGLAPTVGRYPGLTVDGVDIDTFNITWASDVLDPGDTSASIDLPAKTDNWNLIYIILSVRSETQTGNTLDYLFKY